mgnify:CR=1 FL=1
MTPNHSPSLYRTARALLAVVLLAPAWFGAAAQADRFPSKPIQIISTATPGSQSDTLLRFDIASATWKVYPLARYRSFTRDIEIDEDGAVYTSVSNFPAWQIEDAQPTLIRLREAGAKLASP